MTKTIKASTVNGMLIALIVVLGFVIIYLSEWYKIFSLFSEDARSIILMNKEDIERSVYGDGMKMKIQKKKLSGELWKDYERLRTKAIMVFSDGGYVKIFDIGSGDVKQYKHDEYLDYLHGIGSYLLPLNSLKYDVRNFLRDTLEDKERDEVEDAPMVYGCLIIPNTDKGLKFMSRSRTMDVNCNWSDISYICPKEGSVSEK